MVSRAMRKVPMLDLAAQYRSIAAEIDEAVRETFESQRFIMGPEVERFEEEVARYTQSDHAIGCASGSDALLLGLMACGVGPGDEVITSPFTFFATAGSVYRLGARPVFVDIEAATFNLDVNSLERAVTARTRALIPVHLFGQCAEMDSVNRAAKEHGLAVIEDAAQAIGAEYKGRRAGSLGSVAAFSFYPSKNLGGAGDGGMLTTNDSELAEKLRVYRVHGARDKYFHDYVGVNSRLDSLQAAILRVKLRHLDRWTAGRRENAARYACLFKESGLIEAGKIRLPVELESNRHVYNQFVIRAENRDGLKRHLAENGVGTEIYYPLALHEQACFKELGYRRGDMPVSERAAAEALALPVYPELGEQELTYVVETVASFYGV